jgi:hypothetical protein
MLTSLASATRQFLLTASLAACTGAPAAGVSEAHSTPTASAPVTASASASAPVTATASASATATASASAPSTDVPRIYAKTRFVWVHPAPSADGSWIGYITVGGSVPLRGSSAEAAKVGGGRGCDAWYAVEPRGFVCLGDATTLDPADSRFAALARDAADVTSPWPYQYAESMGAQRYAHIPTEAEQRSNEWDLERHFDHMRAAKAASDPSAVAKIDKFLIGVDLEPSGSPAPVLIEVGAGVREARPYVAPTSTIAFSRAFDENGRTWLLTSDHAIVPKDRVHIYPRSTFQGVEIGKGVSLPIAFFKKDARPKYRRDNDGKFAASGDTWARLAWVAIAGEPVLDGTKRYYPTSEAGTFILEGDASIARKSETVPWNTPPQDGSRKWLDVSIDAGLLVAYEDREPVFATLISPGRGGAPVPGIDPLKTASTPTGVFRVDGKFKTATMVSSTDDNIVHSEVQYIQNFHGPHALHGAYWHDAWGEWKSGGCVNLSPIDSKRMFEWTDPKVPDGWHGLRSVRELGPATTVVVHR